MDNNLWDQQSQATLCYLYENMKICSWPRIAQEIARGTGRHISPTQCRNRYLELKGPIVKEQWTPEEEKELYRLHDTYGNKWAIISFNLIGRGDNCVKNHFYSKLRKSLRCLKKIAKTFLKKQVKDVSDGVISKLTEATDEAIKDGSDLPEQLITMCHDLKNKLLEYDRELSGVSKSEELEYQKQLIEELNYFNKHYKKKSKKERIALLGTENLKKGRQCKKIKAIQRKKQSFDHNYSSEASQLSEQEGKRQKINNPRKISQNFQSLPKKMINVVLKAPSKHGSEIQEKQPSENPGVNKVEDILRAEGILENGQIGGSLTFLRKDNNSSRSCSARSESSNPDMFGDSHQFLGQEFLFPNSLNHMSEAGDSNQIFNNSNQ